MLDLRPVLLTSGALLAALGCAMIIPAFIDGMARNPDWLAFTASALITLMIGLGFWGTAAGTHPSLTVRQALFMTTASWLLLAIFGAIPFYLSDLQLSYTDAFFESMSGLTTTGSTVITGLDHASAGILVWRALLEWLGGLGIIVMAVAVLPMLQIGGMQLFKAEAFDTAEKILPRATQISGGLTLVYSALTGICLFAFWIAGMTPLDSFIHSMTTVATGGFSSKDSSMGYFQSAQIEWTCITFMILGSLPFILYIKAIGGDFISFWRDSQVRLFLSLLTVLIMIMFVFQVQENINEGSDAFRTAVFNVTSIMTGTGFATANYNAWGTFSVSFFFFIMFIGGCAGSTSCGIKIFRFQVLFSNLNLHLKKLIYPDGIFPIRYNGRPLGDNVSSAVMSFVFLYFSSFAVLTILLSFTGIDSITAISGAATAISNVGPGLGDVIGPSGNFSTLPDIAKWLLAIGMLIGRLEIFTVLVLFLPSFWRH